MKKILLVLLLLVCGSCSKQEEISNFDAFLRGKEFSDVIFKFNEIKELDTKKLFDNYYLSYKNSQSFDFDLHSSHYILVDLDYRDVLYSKSSDEQIYPASLTKLITLDTVLSRIDDLNLYSYYTDEQWLDLVKQNASMAGLKANKLYTIKDLLYALILPSGADSAKALENYFEDNGMNLIEEMNLHCQELGISHSLLFNTTGLHNDLHVTTLDDLTVIYRDILRYPIGKEVLSSLEYELEDGTIVKSTIKPLEDIDKVEILGGKTGFTGEAGQNISVYYRKDNHYYLLILTGAMGNSANKEYYHYDDVKTIIDNLY